MRRRVLLASAAPAALIVAVVSSASVAHAMRGYTEISLACMRVSDAIRSHLDIVAAATFASLALIALLAAASASIQQRRTRRVISDIKSGRVLTIPGELRALASQLRLADHIDLVDADEPFAFCHGLKRPRLIISRGVLDILDPHELEAVLRHEAAHLHASDPLRILVSRAIATALTFVPFSAGLRDSYLCRRELRADRAAVDAMGDTLPMASALATMLGAGHSSAFASLAVGALSATDIRIDHLLGRATPETALLRGVNPLHALAFATLSMLLLCVLVATTHAATGVRPCLPC